MSVLTENRDDRQSGVWDTYSAAAGNHDEMALPGGQPRPHWKSFVQALGASGQQVLAARWENARRMLREHGVTYTVYGDAQGIERPWDLDLIPLLISSEEWSRVETGLIQRARLLNLILADIYGPQALIRAGALPPALVQANPAFLRPCHGIASPGGVYLCLHAVDLARSPDGQWWVLADRTQAPSGAGYALENRFIISRLLADEFRDAQVQRLTGFFQTMRETLESLAPRPRQHPSVVVLTPGPYNETYFEHAYLARHLGFPLAEGDDLTVRHGRVWVKTLEGLQPVDVILRRLDDDFCDQLELRANSSLGVPGLLQAARAGNLAVANAVGAGVVETPALSAFLPALSRSLLGEDLSLPSVATWWCGQEHELDYVLDHLDQLVIKPAFPGGPREPVFPRNLSQAQRAALIERLKANPHAFVAQEMVALSTAPTWVKDHLQPRPMVLRAYLCASGNSYVAMPGGLTRVSHSLEDPIVSLQSGGGSKDTWILGPPRLQAPAPKISTQPARTERTDADTPSRAADNLFWLGRYTERLEDTIRILRCALGRMLGETGYEESLDVETLHRLLRQLDLLPERSRVSPMAIEREILLVIYQTHRLGTIRELLDRLRGIAFVVRDRLSQDTWRIFHKLQMDGRTRPGQPAAAAALGLLNTLIVNLAAFSGVEMENMTRGHGWRFLDIGRRLERSMNILSLIEAGVLLENQGCPILGPMLEIADSVITYRRRYFAQPELLSVLGLLLDDETNPRALAFQFKTLAAHAASLPGWDPKGDQEPSEPQRIASLCLKLQANDIPAVIEAVRAGQLDEAALFVQQIATQMRTVSDIITHRFFRHAPACPD